MKFILLKQFILSILLLMLLTKCKKEDFATTPNSLVVNPSDTIMGVGDIYKDKAAYTFNGYMGANNGSSFKVDYKCKTSPHKGNYCMSISFDGTESWTGCVIFNTTAWKDSVGLDLAGYTKLSFWVNCNATALKNGQIHMGMKMTDNGFTGSFFNWTDTNWKQFVVVLLPSVQTVPVNYLFEFSQDKPVAGSVIYIDDIQYLP